MESNRDSGLGGKSALLIRRSGVASSTGVTAFVALVSFFILAVFVMKRNDCHPQRREGKGILSDRFCDYSTCFSKQNKFFKRGNVNSSFGYGFRFHSQFSL